MESAENARLSRRRMLGLSTMAVGLAAAGCGTAAPKLTNGDMVGGGTLQGSRITPQPLNGVLGIDVDQNLPDTNFGEMRDLSATWLRGFYEMPDADKGDVAGQAGIRKLLSAAEQGYGTVLGLKFKYDEGLPDTGGSGMQEAFGRLDKVLDAVMGKIDVVTVGNEPWLECGGKTGNLNEFYQALAKRTIDRRNRSGGRSGKTQIYMGAFNDLEEPGGQNEVTDRWLEFVKSDPDIAGTDIHPHVPSLQDGRKFADYVIARMRPDQKFLVTEFSLVKRYKDHLTDRVPAQFADKYQVPKDTQVWQVVANAIKEPVPQEKWNDLLLMSPWFAEAKQFMTNLIGDYRDTGRMAMAAYPVQQGDPMVRDFGPKSTPWVFTSMYCPKTVQQGENGLPGQNTTWTDSFRALQHT